MITISVAVDNHLQEREAERREEDRLRRSFLPTPVNNVVAKDPSRAPVVAAISTSIPEPTSTSPSTIAATTSTSRPAASFTRLTEADRQYRFDNRLCLYCGKPGHIKRDCPTKPVLSNSNISAVVADTPPSSVNVDAGKA
jgi:hypothetical protein